MSAALRARSLALADLAAAYRDGRTTPVDVVNLVYERIGALPERGIWISLLSRESALEHAMNLTGADPASLPLYGIPFALKDNMDFAGARTTAACPAYAYTASVTAPVVERLMRAGAIPIGKTNLDQFATGLVGVRSPYGACGNSFNPDYISGGSSAGSAVAVALGLASFSLGTDTAGSGRVPAAFNNLIGLKPSLGRLSIRGIVPCSRSIDTVSIFALTAQDAARVCRVAEGFDAADPFSRRIPPAARSIELIRRPFRFGVPQPHQLRFFGNADYPPLFDAAVARLQRLRGEAVLIDFATFAEASALFVRGPWVAERYLVVEEVLRRAPEALHPVTREVIENGARIPLVEALRVLYRLQELRRLTEPVWDDIDVLVTPTVGTHYLIAAIEADPLRLNLNLGYYTNFMNLLDLAGVAVPAGFTGAALPFGVTLVGPAWSERALLQLAADMQHHETARLGAQNILLPDEPNFDWTR
jgi:allophanate hydrolase